MRKIVLQFSFLMLCITLSAQNDSGYLQIKQGSRVRYAMYYANKLRGYIERTVTNLTEDGRKQDVTHLYTILNKKGKPSKSANMIGYGDGLQQTITAEDGAYNLTLDCLSGGGMYNRSGFLFKMPKTLKVGDELEGSTLKTTQKFMGASINFSSTFSNVKVVGEQTLNTPVGDIHCMKITCNVKEITGRSETNDEQTIYVSPGIGIVRQEGSIYGGIKTEIVEMEGL